MKHPKFDVLLENFENALKNKKLGYAGRLRKLSYAGNIIRVHEKEGLEWLDDEIVAKYLQDIDDRFYEEKMGKPYYQNLMRNIQQFLEFCKSGTIDTTYSHKGSRYTLSPEFEKIADDFLASGDFHPNTQNDMRWVSHKYFSWLESCEIYDLSTVGAGELQRFMLECAKQHPPNSIHNIRLFMKKLYSFLYDCGLSHSAHVESANLFIH